MILTHGHNDHIGGATTFPGATFVSHKMTADLLRVYIDPDRPVPDITFAGSTTVSRSAASGSSRSTLARTTSTAVNAFAHDNIKAVIVSLGTDEPNVPAADLALLLTDMQTNTCRLGVAALMVMHPAAAAVAVPISPVC